MGVDYDANYGIGVWLTDIDFSERKESIDNMYDYIENLPESKDIETEYFEIGSGAYSGEDNPICLCIKEELVKENIKNLGPLIDMFTSYLKENKIKYKGEVGLIGGIHIC